MTAKLAKPSFDKGRRGCAVSDVILFLLATGTRLNEALQATFSQIDLHKQFWKIPAANSKSKRMRAVALGNVAFNLVTKLQLTRLKPDDGSEFIFRSSRTGRPLKNVHKVWDGIRTKSELKDLRIHDLRHTYASMLAQQGFSLIIIKEQLGHREISTSLRYTHLTQASLFDAPNSASRLIGASIHEAAATEAP